MKDVERRKQSQYERTADIYETDRYHELRHMVFYLEFRAHTITQAIRDHLSPERPMTMVEVGCGTGVNLPYWREAFPKARVVGLDLTMAMLQRAREKTLPLDPGVQLCQGSCFELPFADGSVDALVATRFIHQFPHDLKKSFYEELRRVARPGGIIVVEFYARPYAFLHYLVPRRAAWWRKSNAPQNAPPEQYFSHYPTGREVREIVGSSFRRLPVRPAFCRLLYRALGKKGTRALTRAMRFDPLGILYSEYVAVSRT